MCGKVAESGYGRKAFQVDDKTRLAIRANSQINDESVLSQYTACANDIDALFHTLISSHRSLGAALTARQR